MIKAISLKPIAYPSVKDEDENPTLWMVRGLTRLEWMDAENSLESSSIELDGDNVKQISNQTNSGTVNKLFLDNGLTGWSNFKDDEVDIPFSLANMDKIPKEVRDELSKKIRDLTSITSEQVKN